MPIWKNRWENTKVYRPNGTLYAGARSVGRDASPAEAVTAARDAFRVEFGRLPVQERVVFEVVGATAVYDATVFELPEER